METFDRCRWLPAIAELNLNALCIGLIVSDAPSSFLLMLRTTSTNGIAVEIGGGNRPCLLYTNFSGPFNRNCAWPQSHLSDEFAAVLNNSSLQPISLGLRNWRAQGKSTAHNLSCAAWLYARRRAAGTELAFAAGITVCRSAAIPFLSTSAKMSRFPR